MSFVREDAHSSTEENILLVYPDLLLYNKDLWSERNLTLYGKNIYC